jgi:NAD(P) transhydrogenase subunit alpha
MPGRIAASASLLYAKNLYTFLETMVDKGSKQIALNREDELVKATMLTDGGAVVHPNFANAAKTAGDKIAAPKKVASSKAAATGKTRAKKAPATPKGGA